MNQSAMIKKIRQIFLFLIPTLIVTLIFILLNQQNIFVTDDSDSASVRIEASDSPTKHLIHNNSSTLFFNFNVNNGTPILIANGNTPVFIFLFNHCGKLCNIKNRSPPMMINA